MDGIIKIWEFFNSKKTAIGALLLASADFVIAMGYPDIAAPMKNIGYAFTGVGITHKGYKSTK